MIHVTGIHVELGGRVAQINNVDAVVALLDIKVGVDIGLFNGSRSDAVAAVLPHLLVLALPRAQDDISCLPAMAHGPTPFWYSVDAALAYQPISAAAAAAAVPAASCTPLDPLNTGRHVPHPRQQACVVSASAFAQ
jgi:hypothetical protein